MAERQKLHCESMTSVHCLLTCSIPIPQCEQDTSPHLSIPQTSRKIERERWEMMEGKTETEKRENTAHLQHIKRYNQPSTENESWIEREEKLGA